jgi:hypothetical protein
MNIDKFRSLVDDIDLAAPSEQGNADSHGNAANVREALLARGWANQFREWAGRLREAISTGIDHR